MVVLMLKMVSEVQCISIVGSIYLQQYNVIYAIYFVIFRLDNQLLQYIVCSLVIVAAAYRVLFCVSHIQVRLKTRAMKSNSRGAQLLACKACCSCTSRRTPLLARVVALYSAPKAPKCGNAATPSLNRRSC